MLILPAASSAWPKRRIAGRACNATPLLPLCVLVMRLSQREIQLITALNFAREEVRESVDLKQIDELDSQKFSSNNVRDILNAKTLTKLCSHQAGSSSGSRLCPPARCSSRQLANRELKALLHSAHFMISLGPRGAGPPVSLRVF